MILLLGCLQRGEPKVILHLQKVRGGRSAEELQSLDVSTLGSYVDRRIPHIVLLQELCDEDVAAEELLKGLQGVILGTHVQHSLILVVPQIEVLTRAVEVLLKHRYIVVLESVVEGKVAVVVEDVGSWLDLVHDRVLFVDAHDVLNRLPLVVLLATSHEESVIPTEPIEDVFVTISCTLKQGVLSEVVLKLGVKSIVFVFFENLEHLHVFILGRKEDGRVSLEVLR